MAVTFKTPGTIKLVELADASTAALKVLEPWWTIDHDDPMLAVFKPISEQAHLYVRAIDSSFLAAQQGFNIAEDAIKLSELRRDKVSKAEQDRFARSMVVLARQANNRAQSSLSQFRDVRIKVLSLIESTDKTLQEHQIDMKDKLDGLREGVDTLETLSRNLNNYVAWWSWMSMSADAQIQSTEQLKVKHTSLRSQSIVRTWVQLRENFVQYTVKISELQDTYPAMFLESTGNSRAIQQALVLMDAVPQPEKLSVQIPRSRRTSFMCIDGQCTVM